MRTSAVPYVAISGPHSGRGHEGALVPRLGIGLVGESLGEPGDGRGDDAAGVLPSGVETAADTPRLIGHVGGGSFFRDAVRGPPRHAVQLAGEIECDRAQRGVPDAGLWVGQPLVPKSPLLFWQRAREQREPGVLEGPQTCVTAWRLVHVHEVGVAVDSDRGLQGERSPEDHRRAGALRAVAFFAEVFLAAGFFAATFFVTGVCPEPRAFMDSLIASVHCGPAGSVMR